MFVPIQTKYVNIKYIIYTHLNPSIYLHISLSVCLSKIIINHLTIYNIYEWTSCEVNPGTVLHCDVR